jgi:hypothetical protein
VTKGNVYNQIINNKIGTDSTNIRKRIKTKVHDDTFDKSRIKVSNESNRESDNKEKVLRYYYLYIMCPYLYLLLCILVISTFCMPLKSLKVLMS